MNTETENYYYFFCSGKCPQRFVLAIIQLSVRRLRYLQIIFLCPLIRLFNKFKRLNVNFGVLDVLLELLMT